MQLITYCLTACTPPGRLPARARPFARTLSLTPEATLLQVCAHPKSHFHGLHATSEGRRTAACLPRAPTPVSGAASQERGSLSLHGTQERAQGCLTTQGLGQTHATARPWRSHNAHSLALAGLTQAQCPARCQATCRRRRP